MFHSKIDCTDVPRFLYLWTELTRPRDIHSLFHPFPFSARAYFVLNEHAKDMTDSLQTQRVTSLPPNVCLACPIFSPHPPPLSPKSSDCPYPACSLSTCIFKLEHRLSPSSPSQPKAVLEMVPNWQLAISHFHRVLTC